LLLEGERDLVGGVLGLLQFGDGVDERPGATLVRSGATGAAAVGDKLIGRVRWTSPLLLSEVPVDGL
jgi:hypothetical protein